MQAVAGQMLTFFAELGCQFPQFPFIAHSRGWSAEDMENNEQYVRDSKFLHDGAVALVRRSADTARVMIETSLGRPGTGGRKGQALDTVKLREYARMKKYLAEFIGTFWLVLGGCGSAVLAAAFPDVGIGLLGVVAGLRPDRADHGLRHRPHLGLPPEPGRLGRPLCRRPLPGRGSSCPTSSPRCSGGIVGGGVLYVIASGKRGLRRRGGLRLERLRRALAGRLLAARRRSSPRS